MLIMLRPILFAAALLSMTAAPASAADAPDLAGFDHLEGRVKVGLKANREPGQLIVLARSVKGKPYDMLFVDAGHDGSVADDKSLTATPNVVRGKFWSNFTGALTV